jgi:dUTP pyrophosphatase
MQRPEFKAPTQFEYSLDHVVQKNLKYLDPEILPNLLQLLNDINRNQVLNVFFKQKHPKAKLPFRKHNSDTGYDLFAVEEKVISPKSDAVVETGIEVAHVPPGYWYLILPRSGLGFLHGIQPHLGVIDNGYRGTLGVKLYNFSDKEYVVKEGDRIAQLAFFPLVQIQPQWTEETSSTARGIDGFGSSGK